MIFWRKWKGEMVAVIVFGGQDIVPLRSPDAVSPRQYSSKKYRLAVTTLRTPDARSAQSNIVIVCFQSYAPTLRCRCVVTTRLIANKDYVTVPLASRFSVDIILPNGSVDVNFNVDWKSWLAVGVCGDISVNVLSRAAVLAANAFASMPSLVNMIWYIAHFVCFGQCPADLLTV